MARHTMPLVRNYKRINV